MARFLLVWMLGGVMICQTLCAGQSVAQGLPDSVAVSFSITEDGVWLADDTLKPAHKTKGETLLWWALGGPVGLHRIYLGTRPIVPVFYALTLGGGMGLLVVADLMVIIFCKDINRWAENDSILMWVTEKSKTLPSAD